MPTSQQLHNFLSILAMRHSPTESTSVFVVSVSTRTKDASSTDARDAVSSLGDAFAPIPLDELDLRVLDEFVPLELDEFVLGRLDEFVLGKLDEFVRWTVDKQEA